MLGFLSLAALNFKRTKTNQIKYPHLEQRQSAKMQLESLDAVAQL